MTWNPTKVRVIVNPNADGGRVQKRWRDLQPELTRRLGNVSFAFTTGPQDADVQVDDALQAGCDTILAMGGDGTLGAVASAVSKTGSTFGILPAGTGGDFRRQFPWATDALTAAAALPGLTRTPTDMGLVSCIDDAGNPWEGRFLNLASAGVSGLVDRYVNRSRRLLGGSLTFAVATLRAISVFTPMRAQLILDGHDLGEFPASTVIVANGQYAGGGMRFAPRAVLDDGLLDVVVLPPATLGQTLMNARSLYRGSHVDRKDVNWFRGRQLQLNPLHGDSWIDIDGEAPGQGPATFSVQSAALQMLR
jgi:diacylglycerol kinase (ATP)